jgi:hypothetical protein
MRNLSIPTNKIPSRIITQATNVSDIALDNAYGYGLSTDHNSFGYQANKLSATFALCAIVGNNERDIEVIANAVHDGWSFAAYNVYDPRYEAQPQKKVNRVALADTLYSDLDEEEKEKDRVIARAILAFVDNGGAL